MNWWALLAFYAGGALGMWVVAVTAAEKVQAAKRLYWRRRAKLLRKRQSEAEGRAIARVASRYRVQLETRVRSQLGRDVTLLSPLAAVVAFVMMTRPRAFLAAQVFAVVKL